jgi:hypothetical protein
MDMKISIFGILLLVAGALAAVALFINWFGVSAVGFAEKETAWSMMNEEGSKEILKYSYMPIVLLVLAIVAIVVGVVSFLGLGDPLNMIMKIAAIVVGILIIVLSYLFASDVLSVLKDMGIEEVGAKISYEIGFYLSVVAGALMAIVSALSLLKVLPEPA